MTKVSIIEAHSVQRIGLKVLLESDPLITVVDAWDNLQQARLQFTEVLLLSYCAVCDLPPAEVVAGFARDYRVVIYSGKETSISLLAYQYTDAQALLHQSDSDEKVLSSIRLTESDPTQTEYESAKSPAGLSQRESLVLALVGEGYTNDQIARRIGISKHTVDTYLRRIRRKLNLGNKAQLARAAVELSISWAARQNLSSAQQ